MDFNALDKLVFNTRLMLSLERNKEIPNEIIGGRRGYSTVYVVLNNKLVSDVANQVKKPIIIILADAINGYNCIAHLIASLACQYFRLSLEYLLLSFRTI